MSDHPSETRTVPTQEEIRQGFEAEARASMAAALEQVLAQQRMVEAFLRGEPIKVQGQQLQ
jgi:hypothetical protein